MKNIIIKSIFLILFITANVMADSCDNAQTQTELNTCTLAQYEASDKELNTVYNKYRAKLDNNQKTMLKDAQLAWIKYKELSCSFETYGLKGGSAYAMILNQCLAKKTQHRTEELRQLSVDCEEGDLSCPIR